MKVYLDGKFVDSNDAKVSVFDHGLLYGDGVFEGIRQYNGRIFEKDAHLKRLYESAQGIRLKMPYSYGQLSDALEETVAANKFKDCYIRLVCTRGSGTCSRRTSFGPWMTVARMGPILPRPVGSPPSGL